MAINAIRMSSRPIVACVWANFDSVCNVSRTFRAKNQNRLIPFSRTFASSATQPNTAENMSQDDVILETRGNKGLIFLNRPSKLNALNLPMIRKIYPQLRSWELDTKMKMVLIKSTSEKAFCAGGDVKAIALEGPNSELGDLYFREEYRMNNLVGSLSIPYVALIDGVCMGGGVGLSVHAPFRVVSEKALFAMPETAIGLFPDVGGSHFLPRLPGKLGLYLGLTGHRLRGRDIFKAGIATHFVPSDKLKHLEAEILSLENPNIINITNICNKYQEQWEVEYKKEFSLKPHIGRINSAFGQADTVEGIIQNLEKDSSDWGKSTLETLMKMSPTSLKVTYHQLQLGATLTLPECLKMEYRIAQRIMGGNDFFEGVKSVLIDKSHTPVWKPATLQEVSDDMVKAHFEPLAANKELLL